MKNLLNFCFLTLILFSCTDAQNSPSPEKSEDAPKDEYLVFGRFFGFCSGETCIEIYKIEDAKLYEDTLDQYPSSAQAYAGKFVALSQDQYEVVKDLLAQVPSELLAENATFIGSPDAADGGGFYVSLVDERGQVKFWLIDRVRSNIPEYLHGFADLLDAQVDLLSQE